MRARHCCSNADKRVVENARDRYGRKKIKTIILLCIILVPYTLWAKAVLCLRDFYTIILLLCRHAHVNTCDDGVINLLYYYPTRIDEMMSTKSNMQVYRNINFVVVVVVVVVIAIYYHHLKSDVH